MLSDKEIERCKDKKLKKTLNICICIMYIGDKKMKTINVNGTKYYIQSKDDLISLTHELTKKGYNEEEIARILDVSMRTVRKYLSDCW